MSRYEPPTSEPKARQERPAPSSPLPTPEELAAVLREAQELGTFFATDLWHSLRDLGAPHLARCLDALVARGQLEVLPALFLYRAAPRAATRSTAA